MPRGDFERATRRRSQEELAAHDDVASQILGGRVGGGKYLAKTGEVEAGELLLREAIELVSATDCLNWRGNALVGLSEALALGHRPDEAAQALEQAIEFYEQKGNLVSARGARDQLAAIGSPV